MTSAGLVGGCCFPPYRNQAGGTILLVTRSLGFDTPRRRKIRRILTATQPALTGLILVYYGVGGGCWPPYRNQAGGTILLVTRSLGFDTPRRLGYSTGAHWSDARIFRTTQPALTGLILVYFGIRRSHGKFPFLSPSVYFVSSVVWQEALE